jgi:predicted aspartyl protease
MGQVLETLKRPLSIVALIASLVGCETAAPRQYQAAVDDNLASQECRALQAVVGERERYGIVALSSDQEVKIERHGDTYRVPVRINDTITLPFLLDTGASDLVIPADVALTLIRAGALASGDFIGRSRYLLANGSEDVSDLVVLREVKVGEHVVRNVTASISPPRGEPLLGQSFLSKFGAVTLDYKRLMLILSR